MYFVVALILLVGTFIAHLRVSLFKNNLHMGVRLARISLYILFMIIMFVFQLGEGSNGLSPDSAIGLGTVACVCIVLYIVLIIGEKILVAVLERGIISTKIANSTQD